MAAVACMSLMGSKKLATSSIVAIGVIVVVMGLCQVQEAKAQAAGLSLAVLNPSLVPVNVTVGVSVNGSNLVSSLVAGVGANVSLALPLILNINATVRANVSVTNLVNNATVSALVSLNATSALLITPGLPLLLTRVNVGLGSLLGPLFSLIVTLAVSL